MTKIERREVRRRDLQHMPLLQLEGLALATCLGCLRSWGPLRDLYRDEVEDLCREFERRGLRAQWDEIAGRAKAVRAEELKGKVS